MSKRQRVEVKENKNVKFDDGDDADGKSAETEEVCVDLSYADAANSTWAVADADDETKTPVQMSRVMQADYGKYGLEYMPTYNAATREVVRVEIRKFKDSASAKKALKYNQIRLRGVDVDKMEFDVQGALAHCSMRSMRSQHKSILAYDKMDKETMASAQAELEYLEEATQEAIEAIEVFSISSGLPRASDRFYIDNIRNLKDIIADRRDDEWEMRHVH
jgi:hypothetical protein